MRQDAVVCNEPGRRARNEGRRRGPDTGGPTKWEPVVGRLCAQRLLYQTREAFLHASRRTERSFFGGVADSCARRDPVGHTRIRWDTGRYTRQRARLSSVSGRVSDGFRTQNGTKRKQPAGGRVGEGRGRLRSRVKCSGLKRTESRVWREAHPAEGVCEVGASQCGGPDAQERAS